MSEQEFDFESRIIDIPDYPEPGVVFKDITPLFDDAEARPSLTPSPGTSPGEA